jgi:hypothetical protein
MSKHHTMTDELTAPPLMYLPKLCEKEICMPQYDDDDAFENGVLRDRARYHVPMQMRDSQAPMITDGTGDPLGLHRPGCRIATGGSERDARLRDSQCKAIEEAHAEYLDRLTTAWKAGRA